MNIDTVRRQAIRLWRPINGNARSFFLPLVLAAICCLLVVDAAYRRPLRVAQEFDSEPSMARGLHPPERNTQFSYAYTHGEAVLVAPRIGAGSALVRLRMGGPNDRPVHARLGAAGLLVDLGQVASLRVYHVLLPADQNGDLPLIIQSQTVQSTGDGRPLGVMLDWLSIRSLRLAMPASLAASVSLALAFLWLGIVQLKLAYGLKTGMLIAASVLLGASYTLARGKAIVNPSWLIGSALFAGMPLLARASVAVWQGRWRPPRWAWVPTLAWLVTRLGIALVAYIGDPPVPDGGSIPSDRPRPANILVDTFGTRYDSLWFLRIVEQGYTYDSTTQSSVAFFPLLPLLIRGLMPVINNPVIAGLIITNLALLGAAVLFYLLVELEWGNGVAGRAVWYLLIFPTSFFGSAIYTESLFLLTSIGALYYARRQHWALAGLLGSAAALSRLVGLVVAPMLLVEWWMQRYGRRNMGKPSFAALLAPCTVLMGTGAYMYYLQRTFDDPLAFAHTSQQWGRTPKPPWALIPELLVPPEGGWWSGLLSGRLMMNHIMDLGSSVVFFVLGIVLLRQRRWSEGIFVVLGTLIPFSSGVLASQRRYVWVLFPAFVLLARWGEHPWMDRAIATLFLLGLGLFMVMYANGYWVA